MGLAPVLVVAVGAGIALLAFLLGRRECLSSGYGVTWLLCGVALLVWGAVARPLAGGLRLDPDLLAFLLLVSLLLLVLFGSLLLFQAVTLTRLKERILRLAQEVALLRSTLEDRVPERNAGGKQGGGRSPDSRPPSAGEDG